MPLIQVTMIEGRSADTKTALIRGITDAAVDATGAPREFIRVIVEEVPGAPCVRVVVGAPGDRQGVGGVSPLR